MQPARHPAVWFRSRTAAGLTTATEEESCSGRWFGSSYEVLGRVENPLSLQYYCFEVFLVARQVIVGLLRTLH